MKQLARLFLALGLFIMTLALGIALTALPTQTKAENRVVYNMDDCLYCHVEMHPDWKLNPLPTAPYHAALVTPEPEDTSAFCLNCHQLEDVDHYAWDRIQSRIDTTRARVDALKLAIADVVGVNPDWRINVLRTEKSPEQINAERVMTLIGFIEADGSWGIHAPEYTDAILVEAERLMAELQN